MNVALRSFYKKHCDQLYRSIMADKIFLRQLNKMERQHHFDFFLHPDGLKAQVF